MTVLNSSRSRAAVVPRPLVGLDPAPPSRRWIGVVTAGPSDSPTNTAATAATVGSLCHDCVTDLDASAGVVSLMTRAGYHAAAHATDARARHLDEEQFTLGEGPTLDAFDRASEVLALDLRADPWPTRWPLFVPAAARLSIRAALSFPLLAGARSVGVMTVYGSDVVRIDAQRLGRAKTTAEQVTMTLLTGQQDSDDAEGLADDEVGRTPPTSGQDGDGDGEGVVIYYRAEIYQASGMIMAQLNCTIDEAMTRLRAHAFAHDLPLQDVARQVVDRKLRFDPNRK